MYISCLRYRERAGEGDHFPMKHVPPVWEWH